MEGELWLKKDRFIYCLVFWLTLHAINHNHVYSHLRVPLLVAQFIPATQGPEWSNAPSCQAEVEH